MVAGRGVTHSERTSDATRAGRHKLFGIQTWIALPEDREEMAPDFEHHKEAALPLFQDGGATALLILGDAYGKSSPVTMQSEAFYLDVILNPGAAFPLPDNHEDRGIYVSEGSIEVSGDIFEAGRMMVFRPGDRISVKAGPQGARLMALGGATLNEQRYIWWNFVSSSKVESSRQRKTGRRRIGRMVPSGCLRGTRTNSSRSAPSLTAHVHATGSVRRFCLWAIRRQGLFDHHDQTDQYPPA
jgi:redox-sensitive bicupin YhaK (pirin superfamily)